MKKITALLALLAAGSLIVSLVSFHAQAVNSVPPPSCNNPNASILCLASGNGEQEIQNANVYGTRAHWATAFAFIFAGADLGYITYRLEIRGKKSTKSKKSSRPTLTKITAGLVIIAVILVGVTAYSIYEVQTSKASLAAPNGKCYTYTLNQVALGNTSTLVTGCELTLNKTESRFQNGTDRFGSAAIIAAGILAGSLLADMRLGRLPTLRYMRKR